MSEAEAVTGVGAFNRDDYTIKAEIGTGQFGTVHRAASARLGIDVALKHIRAEGSDGGIKIKAEERGAELQRCFSSRYKDLVPEIFEHGRAASGDYYIAMELVDGRPLTELIRASPPDSRKAAELAVAIGDFLVKLHGLSDGKEPILHSDLKPEHVLVLADGSIRVLDLGIAKSLQANKSLTGNAWASAPYASPERLEDGQVRAGDDHWALGVMLFEMASGYHPYYQYMSGDNNATLARAIRRTEPLAPLPTSCGAGLAASIRKMLSPQPAHRYQTAGEIVADLRNFLEGRETTAAAESAKASQRTQVIPRDATSRQVPGPDTVANRPGARRAGSCGARTPKGQNRSHACLLPPATMETSCAGPRRAGSVLHHVHPLRRCGIDPYGTIPPGDRRTATGRCSGRPRRAREHPAPVDVRRVPARASGAAGAHGHAGGASDHGFPE